MPRNIVISLLLVIIASVTCYGQTPLHGLIAGESVRADVERVAGKPVKAITQTLIEYHPAEFDSKVWDKSVTELYVQYRVDSSIVERMEALLNNTVNRAQVFKNFERSTTEGHQPKLPDHASAKGKNGVHLVEYFGAPYYIVLTYQGGDVDSGVARVARYSKELYEAAVSSIAGPPTPIPDANPINPGAPQAGGVSPTTQGLPGPGYMGIGVRQITPEQAKVLGLQAAEGALVDSLTVGGPADRAGLKRGDVIVGFDDQRISDYKELVTRISQTAPGTRMIIDIVRSGENQRITAILGQRPAPLPGGNAPISQPPSAAPPVALSDDLAAVLRPLEAHRAHIFTLSLVTPISTASAKAGDAVRMQVLSTDSTQGAQVMGTILNRSCTGSGSLTPRCLLDFTLDWMMVNGQNVPIVGTMIAVTGSRGQNSVDEEGNTVSIISNYMDAVQKPMTAASINNQPFGPHQQVYYELNANGTRLSLAPGSRFQISFNSDFGRLPQ